MNRELDITPELLPLYQPYAITSDILRSIVHFRNFHKIASPPLHPVYVFSSHLQMFSHLVHTYSIGGQHTLSPTELLQLFALFRRRYSHTISTKFRTSFFPPRHHRTVSSSLHSRSPNARPPLTPQQNLLTAAPESRPISAASKNLTDSRLRGSSSAISSASLDVDGFTFGGDDGSSFVGGGTPLPALLPLLLRLLPTLPPLLFSDLSTASTLRGRPRGRRPLSSFDI